MYRPQPQSYSSPQTSPHHSPYHSPYPSPRQNQHPGKYQHHRQYSAGGQIPSPYQPTYKIQHVQHVVRLQDPPASTLNKMEKRKSPWSTAFYTIFRLLALATNIPLLVVAAKLLQNWPAIFHKAGVPLAAAAIAIVADAMAVLFYVKRHRAFLFVVPLDLLVAIMAAVGVFSLLAAGLVVDGSVPLTDEQAAIIHSYSLYHDLGVIFSGLVCGVRVLSLFVNSILSCLIFTRRRHSPPTVESLQTTELY